MSEREALRTAVRDVVERLERNELSGRNAMIRLRAALSPGPEPVATFPLNDENGPWCGCGQPLGHAVPNVDCDPGPEPVAGLDVVVLGQALTNVIPPVGEVIGGRYAPDVAREYRRLVAAREPS